MIEPAKAEKELISKAMRLLGSRKSKKKAKSSALNGRLGGRPRKISAKTEEDKVEAVFKLVEAAERALRKANEKLKHAERKVKRRPRGPHFAKKLTPEEEAELMSWFHWEEEPLEDVAEVSLAPELKAEMEAVVKEGFRARAKKRHPDTGGSADDMALTNKAVEMLRERHE